MKILVRRDALLKPLQALTGVVEKKQTMAVLSNILMTVKSLASAISDEHSCVLILHGTDGDIELTTIIPIEAIENIEKNNNTPVPPLLQTTVSPRTLLDICRTIPEEAILSLTLQGNFLNVYVNKSTFKLATLPAKDFPQSKETEFDQELPLPQMQFKNLLSRTYFAMAQQDVRPFLNGVFLQIINKTVRCIASDGHRLAMSYINDEKLPECNLQIIIPRKSVIEIMRLLNDTEESTLLSTVEGRFCVKTPDFCFTSKLIQAEYPDYQRLVPRAIYHVDGDKESIKQALMRASILCNEKFRGVRFELATNALHITANNTEQEQAEEIVPVEYTGENLEIGFNVQYLIDALSAINTKSIRCGLTNPTDGMLIEAVNQDETVNHYEPCSIYVVMPMRL